MEVGGLSGTGLSLGGTAAGHTYERLPVERRGLAHPASQPGDPGGIAVGRGSELADKQTDLMEVGSRRPHDQRLQGAGDDLESQAVNVEEGFHLDLLCRPGGCVDRMTVTEDKQAGSAQILGRQRTGIPAPSVEDEEASGIAAFVVQQTHYPDCSVAIGELPLAPGYRVKRDPTNPQNPPDVHQGLGLCEQKIE